MVVRRRKRIQTRRGRQRTYGWGSSKKHRGKGSRGGHGKAGISGKKSQARVHMMFNLGIKRGAAKGFKRTYAAHLEEVRCINIVDIEENLNTWIQAGIAAKKADAVEIDLKKAGYTKVLGSGMPKTKLIIKAAAFSAGAKEKIEKAGGQAVVV